MHGSWLDGRDVVLILLAYGEVLSPTRHQVEPVVDLPMQIFWCGVSVLLALKSKFQSREISRYIECDAVVELVIAVS